MINITVPQMSAMHFLSLGSCLIGPLDPYITKNETISDSFGKEFEAFAQSPGISGENNCEQFSIHGNLYWSPWLQNSPISSTPSNQTGWRTGTRVIPNCTTDYNNQPYTGVKSVGCIGSSGYDCYLETPIVNPRTCRHEGFYISGGHARFFMLQTPNMEMVYPANSHKMISGYDFYDYDLSSAYYDPLTKGYKIRVTFMNYNNPTPWTKITYSDTDWSHTSNTAAIEAAREEVIRQDNVEMRDVKLVTFRSQYEPPPLSKLCGSVTNTINRMLRANSAIPPYDFGTLAMEASSNSKAISTNVIAFLRDLRHPQEMIPKLKNLLSIKTMSNNYLTAQYGILPTISDLQEIIGVFKRMPQFDKSGHKLMHAGHSQRLSSSGLNQMQTTRIKIAVANEENVLQALYQTLESFGVFPTFENLWDLIPYSFVIDWFIDVGAFLERVDTRLLFMSLDIVYVTMSQKDTWELIFQGEDNLAGSVNVVHYHRWVSDQCPVPTLSLAATDRDFDHWFETGALVIQRAH